MNIEAIIKSATAVPLTVANGAAHRARSDARLIKGVFLTMPQHAPTVRIITDLARFSLPITFADGPVCANEPPPAFEVLTTAIPERCAMTIAYERGSQRTGPRTMMPHVVLEAHGVAYVIAHCHLSNVERTFRNDALDHLDFLCAPAQSVADVLGG
jgi:WYL domain